MFEPVELSAWVVAVLILFAAIGLIDRIFAPSFKWFFRRKANRAIDELNQRLHLRIQPFKTTRRQALVDQVLFDPEVIRAVEDHAAELDIPRTVAMKKAEGYAREIVPAFNAYAYTAIGTRISRWLSTFVYRVRLGYANDEALSQIDPESTVVFVMNHRSNMDYLLVTYLASSSATLSYAVGEWARVWLLQSIIRAMGAYFIRRDSGNLLYRRVLARYVHMATRSGVTQAIFPEGGLSRDGALRDPKFGLLSYMIGDFDAESDRDVVFVPVGLNYDRVLEDRVLSDVRKEGERAKIGERTFQFGIGTAIGFVFNLVKLRIIGRLYRYGYACASFGQPVSLKNWLKESSTSIANQDKESGPNPIESFGRELMDQVGKVVPVLPVALVASVFDSSSGEALSELELKSRCFSLMQKLEKAGAYIHIPRSDTDYAIGAGLRMLTLRRLVDERDGLYSAVEAEAPIIRYYANSIGHLLG